MATLYHATTVEKAQSIMQHGFWLFSNDESKFDRDVEVECVYLMDNQSDAENFAFDHHSESVAIVTVEVSDDQELLLDPEYDGNAFYMTEAPDPVEMIIVQDLL